MQLEDENKESFSSWLKELKVNWRLIYLKLISFVQHGLDSSQEAELK